MRAAGALYALAFTALAVAWPVLAGWLVDAVLGPMGDALVAVLAGLLLGGAAIIWREL